MADLRTRAYATLTPAAQARKDKSDEAFVEDQALQAATSSELRRGWETAGLSETANALMTGAAKAYDSGNVEQGKALETEGVRTLKAAQAWAPSVQNFTDINSIDSAARWAGGALGNVRSSVKPALGGLAGAAIGELLTRSAKGAQTGAMIGSGLTGYNQMTDEAIGGAMVDPEIRANKSYSDIINAGRVSGAIQAPLEGLVPAMTVGAVAGLGKRALKGGIAAAAGREITREGAGEFGTEFAQDLVGQGTQNYLKDRGVADDLDYQRALNAGAAGAVAGGAMGGIGGAGHAVHGTLGSAADAVTDVTSDPKNTIDKISAAAGETLAKGFNHLDDYINKVSVDRDLLVLMGGVRPHEADLDGAAFADARRVHADAYAGRVLSQPNLYDPELVKAASDYGQHRDPFVFQGALRGHFDARKQADVDTGIADELNGETKRSKMKTGDVQLTPDDMLDSSGQMTGTQELARQELNTEGRRKAEGVKNAWDQDVGILADLWRKQGVNDGIITATENESDPAKQKAAIAVMSWVARGFKGTDGEIIMPEKMIQAYGKDAQKLVENAYTLAVQQGVVNHEATKDTFTGIKKRVGAMAKQYEADADMIFDNMTPVARSKFEATLDSDSRGEFLSKLGPVAKDLRALANGGEIAKNHEAALDSWFGPRKNTVLDHFYEEKNADAGLNEASVKAANSDDTDDRHIERSGLSDDAVMGDSDWNSMSRLGTDNASLETTSSHKYEPRSKANEYFDMRDAGHADQWSQRTKEKLAVAEGDATQRSVQQIGMVDRELEKAAEAKGGELTADEIKAIHEKLALEHDKIAAPAALPEGAGPGQKAAHKEAIANYDRRVRGSVARLNRRFKAMRVKSEELAKPGVNFSKQDVADIHQSSRDLRGPNATIQHGVLLFDNGNAKPYVTSAAAILRLVHRVKDGSSESFTEYGGDAHSLYEKLMAGISSMLDADPKFTGRIGYIKYAGSQPTWLKSLDQLPDDFVFGRKEGRPLTVREALMQRDLSRAKLDAKAKEPNVSDKPYTGTDYRDVKQSTKAKAFSLGKLSTNFNAKLTKDERRGIMEATHEFWEVVKGNDTDAIAEASKAVDELFDKYKPKHVKELSESWSPDDDKTPSENTAFAGQDQGDMLLREDDPSKIGEDNPIHRDEHGFLKTDNATMKAANMGSSGSAVKGKVEPGVATKTKKAVERGTLSPKTVIEWLRSSVGKVMSNLREQIENGHLDSAKDAVDRLENLSEMTVARVMALAPDMSEINAERLISRAKNALQRARAIVDAEEGGVSDERVTENGASKEVGQGRSGNLRKVGHAPAAERTGHSANTGPVAGEVQRHGREGVAEGADAKTRLSMEDVKTLLNDMVATRNADTSLLRKILRDGDISHELRTELTNDLVYLESIKAGSMEGSVAQKTVDGWSKMFAGGAKIIISRVKGQPSSVKTNMNAFQAVIDGKRYLVTTGGSSKETSLSTLAHEFGHALQFTIFDNASADVRSAVKSAWEKDVAAATADPRSTSRFMSGARLSGAIDNETVESIPDGMFPLRELMGSVGESVFNSEHKEYVLSFEEWFAEQFSRYVTSDVDVNLAQDVKGFWRGLIATFKKFFDVVIKPLQPNNTFKGWVDGLRDAKQKHEGADAVADWVSKAVKADPKKLAAVIDKMTPEQINKALDVLDSKQFIKNPELDANEVAAFGRLFDTLAEHLPENKDSNAPQAPQAYREKESAKLKISDLVLAPLSVNDGYAGSLARWAQSEGRLYTPDKFPDMTGKTLLVSVPGEGRGFSGIDALINRAIRAIESGATLVTDNEVNANRGHNKNGEGLLRSALMNAGYFENAGSFYSKWTKGKFSKVSTLFDKRAEKLKAKVQNIMESMSEEDLETLQNDLMSYDFRKGMKVPSLLKDSFDEWLSEYGGVERETMMSHENKDYTIERFFEEVSENPEGFEPAEVAFANHILSGEPLLKSKAKAEGVAAKDEAVEAAKKHILDTVGPNIELSFAKAFRDGGSGSWSKGAVKNAIRLALNGDVLGTAYHESMHEFFDILGKHGGENTQTMLKRVAGNKIILRKLSRLLEGHAEAQAQLSDPEEALAYMYQFWKAGTLSLAPETQSWFQKIEGYIRNTLGMLSDEMKAMKDMAMVDDIFKAFDQGIFADESHRDVMVGVINRDVEKREAVEKAVGEKWNTLVGKAGKYVLSAESVIEAADNKYMTEELRQYNQKTGDAMNGRASYFEAVATKRNQYMNRLEALFKGVDKEDLEVARKALSTKTTPTDPVALKIVEGIRAIQEELFEYSAKKNVARWDDDKNEWVGIEHRKDYYPQVWDVDTLMKNGDAFKAKLLEHHMPELKAIADKANAEIKNGYYAGENTASNEQLTKQTADRQEVTPELVADAILARVLNSGGYVELDESISALGMSPVATSVNRRQLSWIDAKAFDEFKSKDIVNTMTSYVSSMVKRAEHTERFGHGGELTRERADKAVVYEIGGDKLVSDAEKMLPGKIAKWRKAKAKAMSGDVKLFDEPYPTIRSVGEYLYGVREGEAVLKAARAKAVKKLEQSFKAVMALEGTLGADISQNMRAMNSWMMTYQNFRLLSTTLFSSFADVVGLVVNGGELGDAWDGFVSGIREVKLRWGNEKSQDKRALRAETWGTVDAGSFMDALGQTYGSSFLTGTARRMSDQLFKWNGMEGWNRAMRITATSVAERIIRDYKTEGFDHSDKAAVARFEELFGKGFKPEDIKLDADGELDQTDTKNQAAVSKWVNGAILRPNAAQRTIWGSDPHYQMLWHMKQFTYTFQAVILAKVVEQAKLGNYRPAMVMMAGYTPVIIAADAIKEMLIPGDEPPWMKGGLGKFIQHGVDKAGLLGVGQMGYDAFAKDYGAGLAGPAISQLLHVPMDPVAQTTLGALPMGNLARRIAQ